MKKFIFFVSLLALCFTTSCLNGEGSGSSSSAEYHGTLTVIDTETGEVSYSNDKSTVTVTIPNMFEAKLDIVFNDVKFDKMMPALNVKVEGLPFSNTISEGETTINYIFTAENIIPSVGGISYKNYKIDKIEGCLGTNIDVNFTISSKGKSVNFTNRTESTTSEE